VTYRFGDVVLDTTACVLTRDGREIHLSPKGLQLLTCLIEARPKALSKQALHDRVWPDTYVAESSLPVLIREIRNAVGDEQHRIIRTVHRRGYAFAGDVREPVPPGALPTSRHLLFVDDRITPLGEGENLVGRDPEADVTLAFTTVSRHHAVVRVNGDQAILEDLGSKNGTRLAGQLIREPTSLSNGAQISFGSIKATYRFGDWETESVHEPSIES